MTRAISATYRLQLRREFPLSAALALLPYLQRLGVSHLYLSPLLAARPGSPHGYDVVDHGRLNPELGTEEDLRSLAAALRTRDMGILLDIVPNHMAATEHNPSWDDVLQRGRASRFADWFDIEWDAPRARDRVVLPVLGDELETVLQQGHLKPLVRASGARLEYQGRTFPLNPATLPKELQLALWDPAGRPAVDEWAAGQSGQARMRALLDGQHYRLAFWRDADQMNYRRFFDVNDLVALRVETDAVFDATHALVLAWVRDGIIDGLRVDHVDGLSHPSWYLAKLRTALDDARADARLPILVEKILLGDETLPRDWPVQGTTGYDFMTDVEELFIDPAGFTTIEANYRGLRHNPSLNFRAVAHDGKRRVLTGSLRPDVQRVARVARRWRPTVTEHEIGKAIVGFIVHLEVYRTYVVEPGIVSDADRKPLQLAFDAAGNGEAVSADALTLLQDAFFAAPDASDTVRAELVLRLQQLAAPATAKGVEDTALYVYIPLASRNEVGGAPDRSLAQAAERVHAHNVARARDWPAAMIATNTHDTKRSADLRARLDALTAHPDAWARHAARWRRLNKPRKRIVRGKPAPDTNSEYLFYQMLFGLWPAPRPERRVDDLPDAEWISRVRERLVAYMLKAAREAKTRTSWTEADTQYEKALEAFVRETLQAEGDAQFLPDVARLTALLAPGAFQLSLARVLLHCTAPGFPDIYQGDEAWNFTLVDPDNRRPVDFSQGERWLDESDAPDFFPAALRDPRVRQESRVKVGLVARLLRFRRDHPGLFARSDYFPVYADGLFIFARRSSNEVCISIARTRMAPKGIPEDASTITLPSDLAGRWQSVLSGRIVELAGSGQIEVAATTLIDAGHPCELLHLRHE